MNDERLNTSINEASRDPLGLSDLPLLEPPADGWGDVRAALEADRSQGRRRGLAMGLAAAACLVLVAGVAWLNPANTSLPDRSGELAHTELRTTGEAPAGEIAANVSTLEDSPSSLGAVPELIAMSQGLERRLQRLRENTSSMPAESAVYLAELEDLVARVDSQLSDTPESTELWSQRVNLLLDLEAIFQHQFEREYGKMASL